MREITNKFDDDALNLIGSRDLPRLVLFGRFRSPLRMW